MAFKGPKTGKMVLKWDKGAFMFVVIILAALITIVCGLGLLIHYCFPWLELECPRIPQEGGAIIIGGILVAWYLLKC